MIKWKMIKLSFWKFQNRVRRKAIHSHVPSLAGFQSGGYRQSGLEGSTVLRVERERVISSVQFSRSVVSDSLRPHEPKWLYYCTSPPAVYEGLNFPTCSYVPGIVCASNYISSSECVVVASVQFSHSVLSDSLWPQELQHARPHCPSPTPGVHSNPCPSS